MSDDDSDDSWTTQEEFPTEFILRYSSTKFVADHVIVSQCVVVFASQHVKRLLGTLL